MKKYEKTNQLKKKSSKNSLIMILALLVLIPMVAFFCDNGASKATSDFDATRQTLLKSVSANSVIPIYTAFETAAKVLSRAVNAYNTDVQGAGTNKATLLATAKEAWRKAMYAWQEAELTQVGPAGSSSKRTGGKDIRDEIYSWPTSSTCKVDTEIVTKEYDNANFFTTRLVNAYGLDALEYLLFTTFSSSTNTCIPQATINTSGSWAAISDAELEKRAAAYAAAVASNISSQATALKNEWQNGFQADFDNAGKSGAYTLQMTAMNDLYAAIFYLDTQTKDAKLAKATGIRGCTNTAGVCVKDLESLHAAYSKEAVTANLTGFQKLLLGGDVSGANYGFDDYLESLGKTTLAANIKTNVKTAIADAKSISATLKASLTASKADGQDLYNKIKAVTDILKGEFATAMSLTVPSEAAGDAD